MRFPLAVAAACLLAACAGPGASRIDPAGADAVLLGEQHDADSHRDLQQRWVEQLARRGTLGALLLEMAEHGQSTRGVPATATEREVQIALSWNDEAWPWERYRPAVMAAVRAGVPVYGANLPRLRMRTAMGDRSLDELLPGPALKAQQQAIRKGHCDLLPESQISPMTRVQIARDRQMAQAIAQVVAPGKTVVLLAGAGHVDAELGIPQHLPRGVSVRPIVLPLAAAPSAKDYCAELRKRYPNGVSG